MPSLSNNFDPESSQLRSRFGGAILANDYERTEAERVNIFGVINVFWAWGFPSHRQWKVIICLLGLPKGDTHLEIFLANHDNNERIRLQDFSIAVDTNNAAISVPIALNRQFFQPGEYATVVSLVGTDEQKSIPFEVRQKDWPEFSEEEITFARENPNAPNTIRTNIQCAACENPYIFEEAVLPEHEFPSNVHQFPASGEFECTDCGEILQLKDLHGQAREALRDTLQNTMRSK